MSDCPNLSSYFTFDEKIMTFSLNEIRLWEKEKCYKMKDQILPKLAAIFNDEQCLTKKIFILHTMTENFLEGFNSEEEMTKHYEPLLPEVFNVIEDCVRHLNVMKKFISNLRQNKNHGLEFYMNNLEENWKVVSLLLTSVTKICSACGHSLLFISWGLHCVGKFHELNEGTKDPELLGKGIKAIELLEQILTKLLQKDLLQLDLVTNPKQLFFFYLSIQCAYRAVNWQNAEYHALLWKLYANMVIQFDVLKQHFDSSKNSHLRYLCIYILPFLQRITHYVETKMENSSANSIDHDVHMCCCYLRIITFICRKFYEFEDECIEILYNLLYKFYYFLFHCTLKCLPAINYHFRNNVTQNVVALMLCLLGERKFLSLLFQPVRKELRPEVKVAYWLLKLSAVQLLSFSKGISFGNVKCSCHIPFNIISDIMDDLYICDTELLLAYVNMVPYENRLGKVTLYEHINIVLCSSASKCCPRHFNDIERLMLKILLRRTDSVSCLICDIWYFFCRCKSQELVMKYCYLFEKLIQNTPRDSLLWIKFLTKRMIKLTPQLQLSDICPVLDAEIVNEDQTVLKYHTVHLVPHVIDMKLPSFFASFRRLKRLEQIISSEQNESTFTKDLQIETIACLLDLSTYVVAFCKADPKTLLQVLYFATIMWNSKYDLIQIGILPVLQALGHTVQPLGSYQNKVFHYLGKLFSLVLDHDNYIIQHQALCIFYNFAHLTPHKEVVKNCMRSSCNQSMIKQFLKRVKNKTLLSEKRVLETVLCQGKWLRENKNIIPKNVESDILSVVDSQQAMDVEEIEELHVTLKRMKDAAEKLASFKRLPSWALQSIKHTCQFMDKIDN